jgi:hypothetical protein
METTHEPLHLRQTKFCTMKDSVHTYKFYLNNYFNGLFEYGDGWIFKLLRWTQNLHQSMWVHNILYADRYLEDEQILIRPLWRESKSMNMADGWKLKFTFYIMDRSQEPLNLVKWSFVHWKIMGMPASFISTTIFFNGAFEHGSISKLWGYVETST